VHLSKLDLTVAAMKAIMVVTVGSSRQEEVAESDKNDEMPMETDDDDDDHAFDMRKMINSCDTYELLHLVGPGELVRFPITG